MSESKRRIVVISAFVFMFFVGLAILNSAENSPLLAINGTEFFNDEKVVVAINPDSLDLSSLDITIRNGDDVFKYFGLTKDSLEFYPKNEGAYSITLSDKKNIYDNKTIDVKKREYTLSEDSTSTLNVEKSVYGLNEEVRINTKVNGEDVSAVIISADTTYRYLGVPENVSFYPKLPGLYEIRLLRGSEILAKTEFLVIDKDAEAKMIDNSSDNSSDNSIDNNSTDNSSKVSIAGSNDMPGNFMRVHNSDGQVKFIETKRQKSFETNEEVTDVELNQDDVKSIRFENLTTKDPTIGIDEVRNDDVKIEEKRVVQAYALDPQTLNFTAAKVTATAKGNELYKCVDWSFLASTCLGSWKKVMDLIPGKNYTFSINSTDPGFAETGVATINSIKPIYHPGETAKILSAVLNSTGYLVSGANVEINITTPDNDTYGFTNSPLDGTIEEATPGIYSLSFNNTWAEGNYTIDVKATAKNTNFSMSSSFLVESFYEFDILRDVPMSVDPWQGPFSSTINISTYLN